MALQRIEQAGGASIQGIHPVTLDARIPGEMAGLMDRVSEVAEAKIHDPTPAGHKGLREIVAQEAPTAESERTQEVAGAKLSPATSGSIAYKMMEHYIKMVEIICRLKAVKLDGINDLIEKVNQSLETEHFWTTGQGWADLASGFGGGIFKIGAGFLGDSAAAKILDGVAQFAPQLGSTGKTFMQATNLDPQLKKNLIVNIKLPQANEKMRSYGESLKEANQHLEQLLQLQKQAKTKISQG